MAAEPRAPGTARLPALLERSHGWLARMLRSPTSASERGGEPGLDLGALLQVVCGLGVCDAAVQRPASLALRQAVHGLGERLREEMEAGTFDPRAHDPELLLACQRQLAADGRDCLAAALDRPGPPPAARWGWDGDTAGLLLRADPGRLRALAGDVAAATRHGAAPGGVPPAPRAALTRLLPIVITHTLRGYNLGLGAVLLRTAAYLRLPRTRPLRQASAFLATQQQPDGRFGYLAKEAAAPEGAADPALSLYLPVTVACVWALAEALDPSFRLVHQRQEGPGWRCRLS